MFFFETPPFYKLQPLFTAQAGATVPAACARRRKKAFRRNVLSQKTAIFVTGNTILNISCHEKDIRVGPRPQQHRLGRGG